MAAIVLAAGSGQRMGGDKLLLPFEGRPLLLHSLEAAAASRQTSDVVVVVRPGFEPSLQVKDYLLESAGAKAPLWLANERCAEGMGTSLAAGAGAVEAGAYVILLADMPAVDAVLVDRAVRAWRLSSRPVVAPVFRGRRGHPVVVSGELRARLMECGGDEGLRSLIREKPDLVEEIDLGDPACVLDVDRPDDLVRRSRVLIKGAGEHASGTAHRLFRAGLSVVMTEIDRPTAVRRRVSFCSAVQGGEVEVEGVKARCYGPAELGDDSRRLDLLSRTHVPVVVDPVAAIRRIWRPRAVIDARILKRNLDNRLDDAPLVIGYGPGIEAGVDVHAVVETMRGHDLGRIIRRGRAIENTGVPGPIAGESGRRLLSSPASGEVRALKHIGELLEPGDLVCTVGGQEVRAEIAGVLRGLIFPGSVVLSGQKIGDIDPRGDPRFSETISDKARCISGAALELVSSHLAAA